MNTFDTSQPLSAHLNSDALFEMSKMLVALPGKDSETCLNTLCTLRPDLAHRIRSLDGGDYSSLRSAYSSNSGRLPTYQMEPEHFKIPTVRMKLLNAFTQAITKGSMDTMMKRHIESHGFDFSSGPIVKSIKHFSHEDQQTMINTFKEHIAQTLRSDKGTFDTALLMHSGDLGLSSPTADRHLTTLAFQRLNTLLDQALEQALEQARAVDLNPPPEAQSLSRESITALRKFNSHLFSSPTTFHSLKLPATELIPLSADQPFPKRGHNQLFIKQIGEHQFQWHGFDHEGKAHHQPLFANALATASRNFLHASHSVQLVEPHHTLPRFGQNCIAIRPSNSHATSSQPNQRYEIKLFDGPYSENGTRFDTLSPELNATIEAYTQLTPEQQTDQMPQLVEKVIQELGTTEQRDAVAALFSEPGAATPPSKKSAKLLNQLTQRLSRHSHNLTDKADQLLIKRIQSGDRALKQTLADHQFAHHPSPEVNQHVQSTLVALLDKGDFDFELSFFKESTSMGNQKDLECKERLLSHPDPIVQQAAIARIALKIDQGRSDSALFTSDGYNRRPVNAFTRYQEPALAQAVSTRALALLNNESDNTTTGHSGQLSRFKLNIITDALTTQTNPTLQQAATAQLKSAMQAMNESIKRQDVNAFYSPDSHLVQSVFTQVDCTSHTDPEIATLSLKLLLALLEQGQFDRYIDDAFSTQPFLYQQHPNSTVREAVNQRVALKIIADIRSGGFHHAIPKLGEVNSNARSSIADSWIANINTQSNSENISDFFHYFVNSNNSLSTLITDGDANINRVYGCYLEIIQNRDFNLETLVKSFTQVYNFSTSQLSSTSASPESNTILNALKPLLDQFYKVFDAIDQYNPNDFHYSYNAQERKKMLGALSLKSYFYFHSDPNVRNAARRYALKHIQSLTIKDSFECDRYIDKLDSWASMKTGDIETINIQRQLRSKIIHCLNNMANKSAQRFREVSK